MTNVDANQTRARFRSAADAAAERTPLSNDDVRWATKYGCHLARKLWGFPTDEVEGIVSLALVQAAKSWRPGGGVPFHGYAKPWVRYAVMEAWRAWRAKGGRRIEVPLDEAIEVGVPPAAEDRVALREWAERVAQMTIRDAWDAYSAVHHSNSDKSVAKSLIAFFGDLSAASISFADVAAFRRNHRHRSSSWMYGNLELLRRILRCLGISPIALVEPLRSLEAQRRRRRAAGAARRAA